MIFRNYLIWALRSIVHQKIYSFVNLASLVVAFTCTAFIVLVIANEVSYDTWIPDTDGVYLINSAFSIPHQQTMYSNGAPFPLAAAMSSRMPQLVAETHIMPYRMPVRVGGRSFSQTVDVVDPDFFRVFRLPLLAGRRKGALSSPNSVVLTQATARKLFGDGSALGKTLIINATHPMTVTGVLRNIPNNSQLKLDALIPDTSRADPMSPSQKESWYSIGGYSYVRFAPGSDMRSLSRALRSIVDKNFDVKKMGLNVPPSQVLQPHLTPVLDVHLDSRFGGGMTPGGSWVQVYGLAAIAILIILIGSFNFINLSTARSTVRAREVALRKVFGAARRHLIVQYIIDSVLISLVAAAVSLVLFEAFAPIVSRFLGSDVSILPTHTFSVIFIVIGVSVVTGLGAGIYPAFLLSNFRPAEWLRNSAHRTSSGTLRSALVIIQFAISIGLGVASIVIFTQIQYSENLDLGFITHDVVVIDNADNTPVNVRHEFIEQLEASPFIAGVTESASSPFEKVDYTTNVQAAGMPAPLQFRTWFIRPNYVSLYGMKLLAGRVLLRNHALDVMSDANSNVFNVVLNQLAANKLGYTAQQAIGKTIHFGNRLVRVVGVLQDALLDGPRAPVKPTVFVYNATRLKTISVLMRTGSVSRGLAAIDHDWQKLMPEVSIHRYFLDDALASQFEQNSQQAKMLALFVCVAVFVACLGLYGMTMFTTQRRTREIGVRKVFGARTVDVARLLLWQSLIPVLLANLVAWPIAWYCLDQWLQGFAQRIQLSVSYFMIAGLIAIFIATMTILFHVVSVSRAKPALALRHE